MINHNNYCWGEWVVGNKTIKPTFSDTFSISFNPPKRKIGSFKEEMQHFVRDVKTSTDRPIALLLSGGLDSEVLARTLIQQKIEFEAFTCKFTNDQNAHDISYAYTLCEQFNIKHTTILIDPEEFIQSQFDSPKNEQFAGIAVALIYRLSEFLIKQGFFVLSSQGSEFCIEHGNINFYSDNDRIHFLLDGNYSNFTTTEVFKSIVNDPVVRDNYFNKMHKQQALEVRNLMYYYHYPELQKRNKLDGWEYVKGIKAYSDYSCANLNNQKFSIVFEEYI